jgi:hypothetical protein
LKNKQQSLQNTRGFSSVRRLGNLANMTNVDNVVNVGEYGKCDEYGRLRAMRNGFIGRKKNKEASLL